ncbi:MAG: hypothetical protein GTO03_03095 [Planctomycetales bacterium]|nr:hypothetical protein [Planctomycetales bacterium]
MLDSSEEFLAYAHHLEAEHQRLDRLVRQMQDTCADILKLAGGQREARRTALMGGFSDLYDELNRHFAEEEGGACLEEAVSRRPALAPLVKALEGEHGQLLDQLQRIILQLKQDVSGEIFARVADQFQQFVVSLHAHEAAESEILERGFNLSFKEA